MNIKTKYLTIYAGQRGGHRLGGTVLHVATVRSDWRACDWEELYRAFPNGVAKSASKTVGLMWLARYAALRTWAKLKKFA